MKTAAIIQARCGSTRFPNKTFALLAGKPLIWHVVNRLKSAKELDEIVIATTTNPLDDKIEKWCHDNGVRVFRGSENDVLYRYYAANEKVKADIVVRITADDPFKEPRVVDMVVRKLKEENLDYACDIYPPSFPEGLDCEAMTADVLRIQQENSTSAYEREHVTQYVYHNIDKFKIGNVSYKENISHLRWTLDTETDYKMVSIIYDALYKEGGDIFHMEDILAYLKKHPDVAKINSEVERSAMYK